MQLPGEFSPFIEKKVVFCLVVRPLKKTLFLCVSSLSKCHRNVVKNNMANFNIINIICFVIREDVKQLDVDMSASP